MNVVIWARVSSREQREGYSIDAQLRADRLKAQREGWNVVKEGLGLKDGHFTVPEGPGLGVTLNMEVVEKYRVG